MAHPSKVVLLAEDNEDDVIATRRAWEKHDIADELRVVADGQECLDYLYRRGKYSDPATSPQPSLLLLDIDMPKLDGIGVLKAIRKEKAFRHLPVMMLTTSGSDEDLVQSHDLCISAYIVKPFGFDQFSEAIRRITLFWQLVRTPPTCRSRCAQA